MEIFDRPENSLQHLSKNDQHVAVDRRFFKHLVRLLKILVPSLFSGEVEKYFTLSHLSTVSFSFFSKSFFLILVAASLIARTYADVWMIKNSTSVESAIIGRNATLFKENLSRFAYAMPLVIFIFFRNTLFSGLFLISFE